MKLALRLGAPLILLSTGLLAPSDAQNRQKAQASDSSSSSSSESVQVVTRSSNGQERSYRRVVRDGKVVEESGDPSLGRGLAGGGIGAGGPGRIDLDDLLRRARQGAPGAGAQSDSSSSSSSRRIVIRNGEVVEDSATVDGKPVRPGAGVAARPRAGGVGGAVDIDRELERMMDEMRRKAGVDPRAGQGGRRVPGGNSSSSSSSSSRRIVIRDGKVVEDSATQDGRPVDPRDLPDMDDLLKRARGAGLGNTGGAGLGNTELEDLLRDLEGLRTPLRGGSAPARRGSSAPARRGSSAPGSGGSSAPGGGGSGSKPADKAPDRRSEVDRMLRELRGETKNGGPTERRLGRGSRGHQV